MKYQQKLLQILLPKIFAIEHPKIRPALNNIFKLNIPSLIYGKNYINNTITSTHTHGRARPGNACIHPHTHTHLHIHAHARTCRYTHTYAYACMHTDIYTCTHIFIYTHIHIYIHIHIYTYKANLTWNKRNNLFNRNTEININI